MVNDSHSCFVSMPSNHHRRIFCVMMLAAATSLLGSPAGVFEEPLVGDAEPDKVIRLVRELGDPNFQVREEAMRGLCGMGPAAGKALHQAAAQNEDFEIALRARDVLSIFDKLLFVGVDLQVSLSASKVRWDQPVDLLVTLVNRSEYPVRISFAPQDQRNSANPTGSAVQEHPDARQVGWMMDIADWLVVEGPEGDAIELRIDDIDLEPTLEQVVALRADDHPPSDILPPGASRTVEIHQFNRGFARYPLLDRGTYKIHIDYVPGWKDSDLLRNQVGRAVSNVAILEVIDPAPAMVSRAGREADLQLIRLDSWLIAKLINASDQPRLVNKNFGQALPMAQGCWSIVDEDINREEDQFREVFVPFKPGHRFDADKLIRLLPGEDVELAKIREAELIRQFQEQGIDFVSNNKDSFPINFIYENFCDRRWQMRSGQSMIDNPNAPEIFRKVLPRDILSLRATSNSVLVSIEKSLKPHGAHSHQP